MRAHIQVQAPRPPSPCRTCSRCASSWARREPALRNSSSSCRVRSAWPALRSSSCRTCLRSSRSSPRRLRQLLSVASSCPARSEDCLGEGASGRGGWDPKSGFSLDATPSRQKGSCRPGGIWVRAGGPGAVGGCLGHKGSLVSMLARTSQGHNRGCSVVGTVVGTQNGCGVTGKMMGAQRDGGAPRTLWSREVTVGLM